MGNIVVVGGSNTVRTVLRQKLGALISTAAAADQERSWSSWWFFTHRNYEQTITHQQMGWVNAINREVRTQQSRKAHHQRIEAQRRLRQPKLKKTRVKGIVIAR